VGGSPELVKGVLRDVLCGCLDPSAGDDEEQCHGRQDCPTENERAREDLAGDEATNPGDQGQTEPQPTATKMEAC
jgi:hypothetical protein